MKVSEQGFTRLDPDQERNQTTYPRVSMGVVLENASDHVAYRTRVTFDALNADGLSVVYERQKSHTIVEVPMIQPGAKVSVGVTVAADRHSKATKISVRPTVTSWLDPGTVGNGLAPVTTTVHTDDSVRSADGSADLAYTVDNPNCENMVWRGTGISWRDSDGKLIGGDIDTLRGVFPCYAGGTTEPVNAVTHENNVPASVDFSKSGATVFCDVAKRSQEPGDGNPVN